MRVSKCNVVAVHFKQSRVKRHIKLAHNKHMLRGIKVSFKTIYLRCMKALQHGHHNFFKVNRAR